MQTFEDFKKLIQTMSMTRIYKQVMLQSVINVGEQHQKMKLLVTSSLLTSFNVSTIEKQW